MDRALDKVTGATVDAEDLWSLDTIARDRYECFDCGVPMLPCAYEPGKKVRPYFSAREKPHKLNCNADGEIALLTRAKTQSVIVGRDTFPGLMPQRLTLQKIRPLADHGTEVAVVGADIRPQKPSGGASDGRAKQHARSAGTIRSICRAFLKYPFDRNQPLGVPDVSGTTYKTVFYRLKSDKIIRYSNQHLFYAPLNWIRLQPINSHLDVTLSAGEWSKEGASMKATLTKPYRVRLQWNHWSTRSRNALLREIEVVQHEHMQSSKSNKPEKGWLFFVGHQEPADDALFIVDDHRLICCFCAELFYPKHADQNKRKLRP